MRDMVSEPIKIMDLQRGSDAELMNCLKSIVQSDDPDVIELALNSLNEIIVNENSCNFDHCLKRLFTEEEIKNVDQVPNLFDWFSTKFPNFPWPSLSNDMAKFLSKSAEHFKNQPPCLAEILQLFNRYQKKDCYRSPDHEDLCEAIVKILFYMPQPKPKDVKKYCKDLEEIKGFLKSLCRNKDRTDISNTALNCFKTMCELIFSNMNGPKPSTEPSSALVMVLQIVEDNFWKSHMGVVVEEMTSLVKNDEKISKILFYFCKWLLQPPENNVNYLSSWLCLFISHLEPLNKTHIIENIANEILPSMSHYLKLDEFYKISSDNNILIPLVRAIRLHNTYHRMMSQIATYFKNTDLRPTSPKHRFLQEIIYIAYDLRKHVIRYNQPCPQCKGIEDWVRENFPNLPYNKKDIYPSTSYGRLCGSKVGLVNLGNTCYMNSVLQALVMTKQFCNEVLLYKPNDLNEQTVLKNLQNLFALLKFSSRHDLHPDEVLRASRPPYFMPGQQQDSSEFLCHLLDVMYEQEKSIILRNSSSDQSINSPLKVEDKEMTDVEGIQSSQMQEDGSLSMTKWTTEENLSEGVFLKRKTRSLSDFYKGEESAQTQNVLSDSHSDSTDSGIQSVGGEDCTSSSSSTSSPGSSSNYLVHRVFGGELRVSYQCLRCDNQSHNTDSFRDLQLCFLDSLKFTENINVQGLINANYLTPETLTGDNKYRCDKCANLCDASRIIKVLKAPAHLILTLKHFRYNSETRLRQKLRNKIQYDQTIQLPVFDQDPVSYKLYAAVVHSGYSMDYGHYFTYACDADSQWYKFNDSYVSETTFEDFKRLEPPDTPYILFYKKCTDAREQEDVELMSLSKRLQDYVEDDRRMHGEDRRNIHIAKPSALRYNYYNRDRNDDDDDKPPSHCRSGCSVPHNTCLY
ncbi:hypothetical protein TKK_0000027 [Trichogramma kaykai]|uniref:USP domain-containing protein n=1 Tax=Trichogramma kaykai TaxID=54128 RepID=A0ABD2VUL6_9HYME